MIVCCGNKKDEIPQTEITQSKLCDSIYVYDIREANDLKLINKYYYKYDAAGNQVSGTEGDKKYTRSFDSNHNITEQINYSRQVTNENSSNEWLPQNMYQYAYDSNNKMIRMDMYHRGGDIWSHDVSADYSYSLDGCIQFVKYYTNISTGDSIYHTSIKKTNIHGDPIEITDSVLVSKTWSLMQHVAYEYTYDSHGNIVYSKEVVTDNGNTTEQMTENTYSFEYDEDGTILSYIQHFYRRVRISTLIKEEKYIRKYVYYY